MLPLLRHKVPLDLVVHPLRAFFSILLAYTLCVFTLNFLCWQGTQSPFYDPDPAITLNSCYLAIAIFTGIVLGGYTICFRSLPGVPTHKAAAVFFAKKCSLLILIYFALGLPIYFIGGKALYHDGNPVDSGRGTTFAFNSDHDGLAMTGYNRRYFSTGASSASPDLVTIPVVMLGGTGVTMYENVEIVNAYLYHLRTTALVPTMYDVYSLSYRGFTPNTGANYIANERNVIEDSLTVWKRTQGLYPGMRPMLFSHSLGTGPTTALLEKYGKDDEHGPACVGLGMPYSSMHDVIQELSFYTSTVVIWLLDGWQSQKRIRNMHRDVPLEILSAGSDELIAPHHQNIIGENARASDVTFLFSEEADHNGLWKVVMSDDAKHARFMDKCVERVQV